MAVPGAVARRSEREANELREQGIDPTSGAPIAVQATDPAVVTPVAPASAAPTSTEDVEAMKTRLRELEQAQSTQDGRTSAAQQEANDLRRQLELVNGNRTFLETRLTELTERLTAVETENATYKNQTSASSVDKAVAELSNAALTEAQAKEYDADTLDMVERVAKKAMAGVFGPLVERLKVIEGQLGRLKELDKLPKLEQAAEVVSLDQQRSREMEFLRKEVLPHYPDFETVRNTPEWKAYLGRDIPGKGIKVGHLLNGYRQTADAIGIRSVLAQFYEGRKSAPGLDSLVVPAKTNGDAPPKADAPKIKASEYKQKLKDFTSKKLPKPEWEAFRTRWDEAIAANNVEMDVEIR
jgi:hypothetical protein